MHIFPALFAALGVMAISLVGVIFSWGTFGNWLERKLHYLTSFAAGIFLVVSLNLIVEAGEIAPYTQIILWVVAGFSLFLLVGTLVPETHHHHDATHTDIHRSTGARKILLADALHNTVDGIVLISGFLVSVETGIVVSVGILVHEAIQEISEFFVLRQTGLSARQALARNFLVSATILIGVGIGIFLSNFENVIPALLGLAAGAFLHVVFVDLLPHQLKMCNEPYCVRKHIAWALIGVLVLFAIGLML